MLKKEEKAEARKKIDRAARQMIEGQQYLSLQRLYMRLTASPTFDQAVFDAVIIAAATADDASIIQAAEYADAYEQAVQAMSMAGFRPDGSR